MKDRRHNIDLNIVKNPNTWKFGNKEVAIDSMDTLDLLHAALHCVKRIFYYRKQIDYAKRMISKAETSKEIEKYQTKYTFSEDVMTKFSEKLFLLEDRASELGFEIPETYSKLKTRLNSVKQQQEDLVN